MVFPSNQNIFSVFVIFHLQSSSSYCVILLVLECCAKKLKMFKHSESMDSQMMQCSLIHDVHIYVAFSLLGILTYFFIPLQFYIKVNNDSYNMNIAFAQSSISFRSVHCKKFKMRWIIISWYLTMASASTELLQISNFRTICDAKRNPLTIVRDRTGACMWAFHPYVDVLLVTKW